MELAQPRPISVEMLQRKLLKPGENLLTYFLLPKTALAFVISRDDFHLVQMPIGRADIAAMVAAARAPEESVGSGGFTGLAKLDPILLNKLYVSIFQPVEKHLKNARRLLVIADGPLNTLPLEMLVTRFGETEREKFDAARADGKTVLAEYGTLAYLGEQHRFAYLPSLSALASVRLYRKPQVKYDRDLVSFADPVFDQKQSASSILNALTRGIRRGGTVSIPRLPETADEANEIASIIGGRSEIFLREKAQEHTAKTIDLKNTKYVHFATHGLLAGEFTELQEAYSVAESQAEENSPERKLMLVKSSPSKNSELAIMDSTPESPAKGEPALLLSLSGDMQGEDGLLTMSEIISSLDLNAKLVVLSACNTAGESAKANNGEGFAGLTRAFMYAGAEGLLVSHWSVESQATQNLMTETFRNMQTQQDSLQAADNARSTIRNSVVQLNGHPVSRSHPYFWAPFVYVGE
jgi:CHAT domain-containing protein